MRLYLIARFANNHAKPWGCTGPLHEGIPANITGQTRQVLNNVKTVLEAA